LLQALFVSQKKFHEQGKLPATVFARTCAHLGKKQEARHLLREAYDHHQTALLMIRESPDLLTLKGQPEYQEFVHKLNLPRP
jgi:hypothetical protein